MFSAFDAILIIVFIISFQQVTSIQYLYFQLIIRPVFEKIILMSTKVQNYDMWEWDCTIKILRN